MAVKGLFCCENFLFGVLEGGGVGEERWDGGLRHQRCPFLCRGESDPLGLGDRDPHSPLPAGDTVPPSLPRFGGRSPVRRGRFFCWDCETAAGSRGSRTPQRRGRGFGRSFVWEDALSAATSPLPATCWARSWQSSSCSALTPSGPPRPALLPPFKAGTPARFGILRAGVGV